MAAKKRRARKPNLLSHTRPPMLKPPPTLSSHATRDVICKHHTLQKVLSRALQDNDGTRAEVLRGEIEAAGGLQTYQRASMLGQSATRGGDSSKILMGWLEPLLENSSVTNDASSAPKLRLLEVGALSVDNACSRSGIFDVERIDLHSQHTEILQQDFMERPLPTKAKMHEKGFDVVSLSLVVNYVGDAKERGDMLRRVGSFLRSGGRSRRTNDEALRSLEGVLPSLFLVLPAPCLQNSRYFDDDLLERMMLSEGYILARKKMSQKLAYFLWHFKGHDQVQRKPFGRKELKPGGARNNFSIVMREISN
ncbi:hypothetical protein MMC13_001560 [Lambiella insularis]|nr:hypothetical protein [Lambiella insularis]